MPNQDESDSRPQIEKLKDSEEFIRLFTRSQRRLFLYILSQVPNPVEADEILQETNLVVWKKSHQFQPGTNFTAWSSRIATYEVYKFRDRRKREKLYFSESFLQQVADEALERCDDDEARHAALMECMKRLRSEDRELIQKRYAPGENGISVAKMLGRPVNSVYQSLGRIRRVLLDCVNRRLTAEAHG